ncbi:hypothetical protein ABGB16_24035 [Micromonospora sp. B11E3]|uniref:hypothetical protein n=1 Tax=Micromonospora sp. B11E3 TaxID=3153562 RepID=UPI00325EF5B2
MIIEGSLRLVDRSKQVMPACHHHRSRLCQTRRLSPCPNRCRDLAATGVVNNAWRNSAVEDWHAGDGPPIDGDMLRIKSRTCWRVRQIIRRCRHEVDLAADAATGQLDDVSVDDRDWRAVRIWRWLVNSQRLLPGGLRLVEIAGDDLAEYSDMSPECWAGGQSQPRNGVADTPPGAPRHTVGWRAAIGGTRRPGPAWSTVSSPSLTSRRIGTGVPTASGTDVLGVDATATATATATEQLDHRFTLA